MTGATPRRRLLHVGGLLVLVAVLVPFALTAVPQLALADQSYVVRSDSMEPAIEAGDLVIVNSVPAQDIEAGDVIAYDSGDRVVTHRVVDVLDHGGSVEFRTKGDANEEPDPHPVAADAVVGRVMVMVPVIGYVVDFANTGTGLLTLVVVPAVLLGVSELWAVASAAGSEDDAGGDPL